MISFPYDSSSKNMYVHMESIQKRKEGGISFVSYEKAVGGL